jgi:hypothetical protein
MPAPVLRPLSLGEVLDVSFGLYRSRFAPLLVVSVACQLVPSLLSAYFGTTGTMFVNIPLLLLYYALAIVLSAVGVAASTFIVSDAYLGRQTSASAALGRAMTMIGRIILVSMASSLLIFVGFLLLIVPGIVLLSGLILSTVVTVLETPESSTAAMGRSWELTKGFRGKVLLTMICVGLLLMVPTITVGVIWGVVGASTGDVGMVGTEVVTSLLSILIYPFFYVVLTVIYYDLRVRKEGFDLELLASQMAPV